MQGLNTPIARHAWLAALSIGTAVACRAPTDGDGDASADPSFSVEGDTSIGSTTAEVEPVANGSLYSLQVGDASLEVDAAVAGRVTRLSLAGQNLLTGPDVNAQNYGSTFWTSPQSVWNWPPPAAVDNSPATASIEGNVVSVAGTVDSGIGMSVNKRFWADPATQSFDLEYSIVNQGSAPVDVAPWEVSRVAPGGLSFFATGAGGIPSAPATTLTTQDAAGATWFDYATHAPSADQKLFADGSGWLAHVAGNVVFIKQFADVAPGDSAPNEAEIEIFANGVQTYVELEQQGEYTSLPAGSALTWTVTWYLRTLPEGMAATVGNADLVSFVNQVLSGG